MNASIYQELERLTTAERRALGEALIRSAEEEQQAPLLSNEQRVELETHLAHSLANPSVPGVTWAELRTKLLAQG